MFMCMNVGAIHGRLMTAWSATYIPTYVPTYIHVRTRFTLQERRSNSWAAYDSLERNIHTYIRTYIRTCANTLHFAGT